ncbi:LOW QUALITY PROTEIN: hypothetical protein HID58_082011 [Brassica napus]|uniref:Uncharacterized protein n=1 Tax=Brassica napus TaxID=3708 RepID=A0ABQ7Y9A2_BRANA|nr:LOW QUALITY PROTEIN: hypothetical protein HID58_082011 [Brassica napus]
MNTLFQDHLTISMDLHCKVSSVVVFVRTRRQDSTERGEELLKAQRLRLSPISVFPTPSSLPRRTHLSVSLALLSDEDPSFTTLEAGTSRSDSGGADRTLSLHLPEALSPPEPPDPPDVPSDIGFLLLFDPPNVVFLIAPFFDTSFRPSPQAFIQISTLKPPSRMATKNGGGGGAHVSASETSFAYGLLSPVVYIFRSVDRPSLSSCFDHPAAHPRKVLHVHLSSLSIYYAIIAICVGDVGIGFHFVLPLRPLVAFISPWRDLLQYAVLLQVPYRLLRRLETHCHLYPDEYGCGSEWDEQASLVLQGSSSYRMLFFAYGAVCVVLRVTLDAIFQEAYDAVVIRFHISLFISSFDRV